MVTQAALRSGTNPFGRVWRGTLICWAAIQFCSFSPGLAAEPSGGAIELLKVAGQTSGSSYGGIAVDAATRESMAEALGKPISDKDRKCVWIGTDQCRRLGLKMVRAIYTDQGLLSHMTLDLREPILRSEAVEQLGLGNPAHVQDAKDVRVELFLPANLALGIHGDQVVRLYLFGRSTPGMQNAASQEQGPENIAPDPLPVTQEELDEDLRLAVSIGDSARVGQLLAAGARAAATDQRGWTALHYAAYAGNAAVIPALVFASAQSQQTGDAPGVPALDSFKQVLDKANSDGATALQLACRESHFEVTQALVRMGADPNIGDKQGMRPLHLAALNDQLDFVQALLLAQANVYLRDCRGCTSLDLATGDEIRHLLEQAAARAGADPAEAKIRELVEAFLEAAREGDAARMKSLVDAPLQKKLPEQVKKSDKAWTIEKIEPWPAGALVKCVLAAGSAKRATFRVRFVEGVWRISDIEIRTEPANPSQ